VELYTDGGYVKADITADADPMTYNWTKSIVVGEYMYAIDDNSQDPSHSILNKVDLSDYSSEAIELSVDPAVGSSMGYIMDEYDGKLYVVGTDKDTLTEHLISVVDLTTFTEDSVHTYSPSTTGYTTGNYVLATGIINDGYFYIYGEGTIDKIKLSDFTNMGHIALGELGVIQITHGLVWAGSNLYCGVEAMLGYNSYNGIAKIDVSDMSIDAVTTHGYENAVCELRTYGNYLFSLSESGNYDGTVQRWTISPFVYDSTTAEATVLRAMVVTQYGSTMYLGYRDGFNIPTGIYPCYLAALDMDTMVLTAVIDDETRSYSIGSVCTDGTNVYCLDDEEYSYAVAISDSSETVIEIGETEIPGGVILSVPYTAGVLALSLEREDDVVTLTVGEETSSDVISGTVVDAASDAVLMSDSVPYMNYFRLYNSGSLSLRIVYQPDTIIIGNVLPDLQDPANDGTITWGTNIEGVIVTDGPITGVSDVVVQGFSPPYPDYAPPIGTEDKYNNPNEIPESLQNNPLHPFMEMIADATEIPEIIIWIQLATFIILAGVILSLAVFQSHILLSGVAGLILTGFFVAIQVYPWWAILGAVTYLAVTIIMERSPTV
jgi:hypothetical protein